MTTTRRVFLMTACVCSAGASLGVRAQALVAETDPTAVTLGYVADASKADTKKFPKYAAGQVCSNCALYQGKATDASAPCPLFPAKQVGAKAWCSAWAKKG